MRVYKKVENGDSNQTDNPLHFILKISVQIDDNNIIKR